MAEVLSMSNTAAKMASACAFFAGAEGGETDAQAANITDEDIDAIIQKGQRATEELNEKMKQYTENAMKFTMDGGIAYEYKDEDDVPEDAPNLKAIAGAECYPCIAFQC